jgi:hypothetical protein
LLKAQDWERQDYVAKLAAESASRLLFVQEQIARGNGELRNEVRVIHSLVNSQMTAAIQAELSATVNSLVLMREVLALHKAQGRELDSMSVKTVNATEQKIAELRATLEERAAHSPAE